MILSDHQITELCLSKSLITPYDHQRVNPCSYDLTVGQYFFLDGQIEKGDSVAGVFYSGDLFLEPGQFVLCETAETINMPKNLAAKIALKSSAARLGYGHSLSGFVDPGFCGVLTLEIMNHSQRRVLELRAGMRLAQIVFHMLDSQPKKGYGEVGHYQHDNMVTQSKVNLFEDK